MKHTPTIVSLALLGLCAGCSISNRVPEGIVRTTNDRHHLQVWVDSEKYYAIYNIREIRDGSTFSSERISAIAVTTNEHLASLLTVSVDEFPQSVEQALRDGGTVQIDDWSNQPSRIMVGDHKYLHQTGERTVAILSENGDEIQTVPGQLTFEDFESEATLSAAIRMKLQLRGSE